MLCLRTRSQRRIVCLIYAGSDRPAHCALRSIVSAVISRKTERVEAPTVASARLQREMLVGTSASCDWTFVYRLGAVAARSSGTAPSLVCQPLCSSARSYRGCVARAREPVPSSQSVRRQTVLFCFGSAVRQSDYHPLARDHSRP